jgi:hypothetical protein
MEFSVFSCFIFWFVFILAVGLNKYNAMLLWHYIFLHVLHLLTYLLTAYLLHAAESLRS